MRKKAEIETAFSPTHSLALVGAFYLVGIGGAGMSGLARMLRHRGYHVGGSDLGGSVEYERLVEEGFDELSIGHSREAVEKFLENHSDPVAIVLSDAIDLATSPEYKAAQERGIPVVRRSQALGWILREYRVIAVTGTHGKTTTTGMVGAGLIASGLDPVVVVGATVPEWGGPIREGNGEYAVVEACEAYDSYQDIEPFLVVLTNLEGDHLDYHGSYESLRDSMVRFVSKVGKEGGLVYCADDRGASEVAELTDVRCLPYGLSRAWLQQVSNKFELGIDVDALPSGKDLDLYLPGDHNRMNATAALAAASFINEGGPCVDLAAFEHGLKRFTGAERRMQVLATSPVTVIDDYAHHPSEIAVTLQAVRERYPNRRVIAVFQPHLYSRTKDAYEEFAVSLDIADLVFVTDIYPAREQPIPGVSSARIGEKCYRPVRYVPSRHLLPREVAAIVEEGDVVIAMGAGNISEFGPDLIAELERVQTPRPRRVLVALGGDSSEREVSLHSGRAVAAALRKIGVEVEVQDLSDLLLRRGTVQSLIGSNRPDVVFLAVHGTNQEDGAVQGLLELLHIPYTGSGIQASALAMDKEMTKKVLAREGIPVPRGVLVRSVEDEIPVSLPVVVKPNAQGSTVGLTFARTPEELRLGIEKALAFDKSVLVEELIEGMEISTPVLVDRALPPVEIAPVSGVYDFGNKYTPGATEEIVPARLPAEVLAKAQETALAAHRALGCSGATRTDAIVRNGEVIVLEVNTLPGMTGTSLLPNSAAAAGISFEELCRIIMEDALSRHASKT